MLTWSFQSIWQRFYNLPAIQGQTSVEVFRSSLARLLAEVPEAVDRIPTDPELFVNFNVRLLNSSGVDISPNNLVFTRKFSNVPSDKFGVATVVVSDGAFVSCTVLKSILFSFLISFRVLRRQRGMPASLLLVLWLISGST